MKQEDPTAEGLFDERLGPVPFELAEYMIKDNRRCLESILGGFSKGMGTPVRRKRTKNHKFSNNK